MAHPVYPGATQFHVGVFIGSEIGTPAEAVAGLEYRATVAVFLQVTGRRGTSEAAANDQHIVVMRRLAAAAGSP